MPRAASVAYNKKHRVTHPLEPALTFTKTSFLTNLKAEGKNDDDEAHEGVDKKISLIFNRVQRRIKSYFHLTRTESLPDQNVHNLTKKEVAEDDSNSPGIFTEQQQQISLIFNRVQRRFKSYFHLTRTESLPDQNVHNLTKKEVAEDDSNSPGIFTEQQQQISRSFYRVQRRIKSYFHLTRTDPLPDRNIHNLTMEEAEGVDPLPDQNIHDLTMEEAEGVDPLPDQNIHNLTMEEAEGVDPLPDQNIHNLTTEVAEGVDDDPIVISNEEQQQEPQGTRWAISANTTDLSGTWKPIVTTEFKKQYDEYLQNCSESVFFRKVVLNTLGLTVDEIKQKEHGRNLTITGRNPAGSWARTLIASGADNNNTDFDPVYVEIKDPDADKVNVEAWWELDGAVHKSILRGKPRVQGGEFETLRYLEGNDTNVLVTESSFRPSPGGKATSFRPGSIKWRYERVSS
jgi:hypothetical protein